MRVDQIRAFVKLGRPRFLMGGLVLHSAGAVLAHSHLRDIDLHAFAVGQCAITSTQLMTHYANDYFDIEADRLNRSATRWSGGSRVLVEDGAIISPRVARNAAIGFGLFALIVDLFILLVYRGERLAALIMLFAALGLSWGYSAPPLRLHPRGLGAFTAALVVGALTPLVGYAMQGGPITFGVVAMIAPLILAQLALILVLDLPDRESDAAAHKKTIAVRFGEARSSRLAIALVALTYAIVFWMNAGLSTASIRATSNAMMITIPIGALLISALVKRKWARDGQEASILTSRAVVWFASLSTAMLVGGLLR